jgi:hypothetical protein
MISPPPPPPQAASVVTTAIHVVLQRANLFMTFPPIYPTLVPAGRVGRTTRVSACCASKPPPGSSPGASFDRRGARSQIVSRTEGLLNLSHGFRRSGEPEARTRGGCGLQASIELADAQTRDESSAAPATSSTTPAPSCVAHSMRPRIGSGTLGRRRGRGLRSSRASAPRAGAPKPHCEV